MTLSTEFNRISSCIETCKQIYVTIENVDIEALGESELANYRILTQDLASITTHTIESLAALQREIRSLKSKAFVFRKGETKESVNRMIEDTVSRLNAMT